MQYTDIFALIIEELGLDTLPEGEREEMLERIGSVIYEGILIKSLDAMSDADATVYENMVDENRSPAELFKFLAEKVPNFEQIIKDEVNLYKKDEKEMREEVIG